MLNKCIMIGRMGTDPEMKYTPSGDAVCNFRIAVDRPTKKDAEKVTDWFDVTCWRQSAEFAANYLAKGRLVAVDGRLQIREYQDKEGNNRKAYEIVANEIKGLDRPKTEGE